MTDLKGQSFDRFMEPVEKDQLQEVISESIIDILWRRIFYVSSFAAESVTTSSSTENVDAKEVDTSEGDKFDPDLPSRYRVNFYLNSGQTNSVVYILSPAISTDPTFATSVPIATNEYLSYVGIKIDQGNINLVSSTEGKEIVRGTNKKITDNTTHTLEIIYRPRSAADIYYDNDLLGSIPANLPAKAQLKTFYPYLTSVKSNSGSVNLTLENYEFVQEKKNG